MEGVLSRWWQLASFVNSVGLGSHTLRSKVCLRLWVSGMFYLLFDQINLFKSFRLLHSTEIALVYILPVGFELFFYSFLY